MPDGKITFIGTLTDSHGNPIDTVNMAVQMFDSALMQWKDLISPIATSGGQFSEEILYGESASGNELQIHDIVMCGCFPTVRLIALDGMTPVNVLSNGGLLSSPLANEFEMDFGTIWYIGDKRIPETKSGVQSELTFARAGVRQPASSHELYQPLMAAINPEETAAEIQALNDQITSKDAEIGTLEAQIIDKEVVITGKDNVIALKQQEINDLNDEIAVKDTEISSLEATIVTKDGEISTLETTVSERDAEITTLEASVVTKDAQITSLESEVQLKDSEIAFYDTQLQLKDAELTTLKVTETQLRTNLESAEAEVKKLTEVIATEPKAESVEKVYEQLVREVETASLNTSSTYSLDSVKLNLKTHFVNDEEGIKLQLMDARRSALVNEGTLSTVEIDILSQAPAPKVSATPIVPALIGLTETATRSKLAEQGLRLRAVYQVDSGRVRGQAFSQTPAAGEDIAPEGTVTVIFAKEGTV